jgi:hypothetical protein
MVYEIWKGTLTLTDDSFSGLLQLFVGYSFYCYTVCCRDGKLYYWRNYWTKLIMRLYSITQQWCIRLHIFMYEQSISPLFTLLLFKIFVAKFYLRLSSLSLFNLTLWIKFYMKYITFYITELTQFLFIGLLYYNHKHSNPNSQCN